MVSLKNFDKLELNGQKLYIITVRLFELMKIEREIEGIKLNKRLINWIEYNLLFSLKHKEFITCIALFNNNNIVSLFPYIILQINGQKQRVVLEQVQCLKCSRFINVANPKIIDSYIGIPTHLDKFSIMKKSNQFEKKSCPNCGNELPRYAIWTELAQIDSKS